MATIPVPGAKSLTAAQLTAAMSLPILGPAVSSIATLAALAAFLPTLSGGASAIVALNTVGAGTITAASIGTKYVQRGGSQSNAAFTDTTDTAAHIVAALPGAYVGQSFLFFYQNGTNATATITGGTNVTVSGISKVQSNSVVAFLMTITALGATPTIAMVGWEQSMPSAVSGTVTANAATPVPVTDSRVTANSTIVLSYKSGTQGATGAFVSSLTAGTGFSITSVASDTAIYNYLILN